MTTDGCSLLWPIEVSVILAMTISTYTLHLGLIRVIKTLTSLYAEWVEANKPQGMNEKSVPSESISVRVEPHRT